MLRLAICLFNQRSVATLEELKRVFHVFNFLLVLHLPQILFLGYLLLLHLFSAFYSTFFKNEIFKTLISILLCYVELSELQPTHVLSCHHFLLKLVDAKNFNLPFNYEWSHLVIYAIPTEFDSLLRLFLLLVPVQLLSFFQT